MDNPKLLYAAIAVAAIAIVCILCFNAFADDRKDPAMDSSDFVLLTDAVPDAILEIRYYSTYNFVGGQD